MTPHRLLRKSPLPTTLQFVQTPVTLSAAHPELVEGFRLWLDRLTMSGLVLVHEIMQASVGAD